jgi:hypothetical protein
MGNQSGTADLESSEFATALAEELERRITELAGSRDETFGRMGISDALLVALLFVGLPLLCVWIFA